LKFALNVHGPHLGSYTYAMDEEVLEEFATGFSRNFSS
jgi:hypothetical protein